MTNERLQLLEDTYTAFHEMRLQCLNNPRKYADLVKAQNRCICNMINFAICMKLDNFVKETRGY